MHDRLCNYWNTGATEDEFLFFYSCSCSKYIHMRAVFEINKYTYMYIAYSNKIYVFNCHFSMSTQILKACIINEIFYFVYVLNIVSKVEEDLIQVLKSKEKNIRWNQYMYIRYMIHIRNIQYCYRAFIRHFISRFTSDNLLRDDWY